MAETQIWTPDSARPLPKFEWTVLLSDGQSVDIIANSLEHSHGALIFWADYPDIRSHQIQNIFGAGEWVSVELTDQIQVTEAPE